MPENKNMSLSTTDKEVLVSRLINAPREKVFDAWIDPEKIINWWGPRGFKNTNIEMNVKPGGVWRYTMHGPDGVDYPNKIVYTEVVEPERLAYDQMGEGEFDDISFRVLVTFEEEGDKTRVTMRSEFPTAEQLRRVVEEFGALEGAEQNLERLSEFTELGSVIS
ncbi:MAG: SRPBCC family protein [Ignavibacteria bacterium]|nr:SRPBCC family protein [Ignavibacteria bacterium]